MTPSEIPCATPTPAFMSGGGELGVVMRKLDWSTSSLGDPFAWQQSLRTAVTLMLNSKFPMFLAWGPELAFLYNDAYSEILGARHPSALGRPFDEVWREIMTEVGPLIQRALRGEATFVENLPLAMTRKGYLEHTWFTFSYSPVVDDAGVPTGVFCACVETTSQVLAEKVRADENERLRDLFEQAPGFMALIYGPEHVFELTNKAYLQLIGYRDLIGKPVRQALPELAGQGFVDLLDHVYQSGEPFVGRAQSILLQRNPDAAQEERFIDFVYQPIKNRTGSVIGIFAEGSDVTERTRAEHELKEGNRRKDEFLAMLAHELRNPLAPISTAAQLLQFDKVTPAQVRHASQIISRQVSHMTDLVDDLLDVSRVTRGLVVLNQQPVLLDEIIADAVEQVRSLLEQRQHRLEVRRAGAPTWVMGDRTRLVQVVANVLNNAARYTPPGGAISVGVVASDTHAEVEIIDNGVGIAAQVLPHIFDLFIQAERSPDRSQGGLGLGLALVSNLVALHGGQVEAHSEGAGKGSRFVIRFPRVAAPSASTAAAEAPRADEAQPDGALRVMVVDDNVDAADALAMVLEAAGHPTLVEHDGRSTLARARTQRVSIFFLDIGLPDMDGYQLARALRAMPETAGAVLVALTGYGQAEDRARSHAAGFDHHLVKPASAAQVFALLKDLGRA